MKNKLTLPYFLLIILAFEKFIQHMVITFAIFTNRDAIRQSLSLDYRIFLVSGFVVGLLFLAAAILLLRRQRGGPILMLFLALFDFFGEFVAQGTLFIAIPMSFLVACLILGILFVWRKELFAPAGQLAQANSG